MIVASKRRNQHDHKPHTANQPPLVIQHPGKKHPHKNPKGNQQKNCPPLKRRLLLVVSEIVHPPFAEYEKQHRDAETVNNFSDLKEPILPDKQKRNPRQYAQQHIDKPLKAMKISVRNGKYHFPKGVVRSAARHTKHTGNHIPKGIHAVKPGNCRKHNKKRDKIPCHA